MRLSFVKYYIIEALKPFYPAVELGKPKEEVRELIPVDFECKNCASCPYYKWEVRNSSHQYGR